MFPLKQAVRTALDHVVHREVNIMIGVLRHLPASSAYINR